MLENLAFAGTVGMILWVAYISIKLDDHNTTRKKKWQPNPGPKQFSPPVDDENSASE